MFASLDAEWDRTKGSPTKPRDVLDASSVLAYWLYWGKP